MKKLKFIGQRLLFCAFLSVVMALSSAAIIVGAVASDDRAVSLDIEKISYEIFGDKKIKSSEYLYNLDDSAE